MGDFLKEMFGGATSDSNSNSTPINMNPFTAALQAPVTSAATSLLSGGIPTYQPNSNLAAPIGANEQSVLSQLMGMTGPNTGRNGLLNDTINGNFLPGSPGGNPFLSAAISAAQRGTANTLNDTLSRSLPGQFLAAGQNVNPTSGSSAFDTAGALYASRAGQTMADIATNMSNTNYQGERQLQQQAVPLQQAEVQTTLNNLQAQALPRLIQQYGIDQGLQAFQQRTTQLLQLLATAGGMAQPVIGNEQQSTSHATQEKGVVPGLTGAFSAGFPKGL